MARSGSDDAVDSVWQHPSTRIVPIEEPRASLKAMELKEGEPRFMHPFTDEDAWKVMPVPLTITDLMMQHLSYTLRSKPQWWDKYQDETVKQKWKEEALAQEIDGRKLSEAEVQWVLDELEGFEELRDRHRNMGIQQSCYSRIYESDTLIDDVILSELQSAVNKLEDDTQDHKDWHPRSNEQVLDLVHPSLYCLVYGRTPSFPPGVQPESRKPTDLQPIQPPFTVKTARSRIAQFPGWSISNKFAWIPTDFQITEDGNSVKALSYINNIHPSRQDLYNVIEKIVPKFVHMFDDVLADLHPDNFNLATICRIDDWYTWDRTEWPQREEGEDYYAFYAREEEWKASRVLTPPTVPKEGYRDGDLAIRKAEYTLQGRRVQIIIKLASIHLSPEKPEYAGGSWHVEGMANEHIVASGIYYYDVENVTESKLAFRTAICSADMKYEQYESRAVEEVWGFTSEMEANQVLGAVKTTPGRCIAFANIYQHQVSPFKLQDPTKPGHRKILALFLVDPGFKIPSTSDIPFQQAEWTSEAVNPATSIFGKLPVELRDAIRDATGQMEEEEAKQYRLELMDERTAFVETQDKNFFEMDFNMCEH